MYKEFVHLDLFIFLPSGILVWVYHMTTDGTDEYAQIYVETCQQMHMRPVAGK